jgi:hypothetical protein
MDACAPAVCDSPPEAGVGDGAGRGLEHLLLRGRERRGFEAEKGRKGVSKEEERVEVLVSTANLPPNAHERPYLRRSARRGTVKGEGLSADDEGTL